MYFVRDYLGDRDHRSELAAWIIYLVGLRDSPISA